MDTDAQYTASISLSDLEGDRAWVSCFLLWSQGQERKIIPKASTTIKQTTKPTKSTRCDREGQAGHGVSRGLWKHRTLQRLKVPNQNFLIVIVGDTLSVKRYYRNSHTRVLCCRSPHYHKSGLVLWQGSSLVSGSTVLNLWFWNLKTFNFDSHVLIVHISEVQCDRPTHARIDQTWNSVSLRLVRPLFPNSRNHDSTSCDYLIFSFFSECL